jgi:nucleoside-diphosphate-sugar epimerase
MKVLVVGAGGHVGSILRPALEGAHDCRYLDALANPQMPDALIGDVNDEALIVRAIQCMDAVIYLATGRPPVALAPCGEIGSAFDVNVRGWYLMLHRGLTAGLRRFIYASTLSVYRLNTHPDAVITEATPPDAWSAYGVSKRIGEFLAQAAAQQYPDATIASLRLFLPQSDEQWRKIPAEKRHPGALGPGDLRRLFLAALALEEPGAHVVQATGDLEGRSFPNTDATALLGWAPQGC